MTRTIQIWLKAFCLRAVCISLAPISWGGIFSSRIIDGTHISLTVGISAVAISLSVGTFMGAIAGYRGGRADTIIMRVMDMMLSIPSILLAIAFMAALGKGIDKAVIAIGLVSIPEYARIVRGCILSVKENDYVQAAKVVGNRDMRIVFKHIMPNILSSIVVRATLGISTAVLDYLGARLFRPWRTATLRRVGGYARARAAVLSSPPPIRSSSPASRSQLRCWRLTC